MKGTRSLILKHLSQREKPVGMFTGVWDPGCFRDLRHLLTSALVAPSGNPPSNLLTPVGGPTETPTHTRAAQGPHSWSGEKPTCQHQSTTTALTHHTGGRVQPPGDIPEPLAMVAMQGCASEPTGQLPQATPSRLGEVADLLKTAK